MDFIRKYNTSKELYLFLKEKLSQLESSTRRGQEEYLYNLPIEERTLLINLMYIGRGDQDDEDYYKENFYDGYQYAHNQWENDSYLVEQMLNKIQFLDYLRNSQEKYSTDFYSK